MSALTQPSRNVFILPPAAPPGPNSYFTGDFKPPLWTSVGLCVSCSMIFLRQLMDTQKLVQFDANHEACCFSSVQLLGPKILTAIVFMDLSVSGNNLNQQLKGFLGLGTL